MEGLISYQKHFNAAAALYPSDDDNTTSQEQCPDTAATLASRTGTSHHHQRTCRYFSSKCAIIFAASFFLASLIFYYRNPATITQYFIFQQASMYLLFDQQGKIDHNQHRQQEQAHHNKWQVIHDTLKLLEDQLDGSVLFYNNDNDQELFDQASQVWVAGSVGPPFAVIQVANEHDVSKTLQQAIVPLMRLYPDVPFRVRSGGHNKAGYSTAANGIVLSLAHMHRICDIDVMAETVTLEPAVTVKQYMQQVVKPYGYAGVVGFCGQVAESGFVLGGGFGMLSRMYGLGMDSLLSMRIVLADGSVEEVSGDSDLFWALRGAGGGSFGVVTEMKLAIHKASRQLEYFSLVLPTALAATFLHHIGKLDSSGGLPGNFVMLVDQYPRAGFFQANILWTGGVDEEVVGSGEKSVLQILSQTILRESSYNVSNGLINWTDWYEPKAPQPAWGRRVWAAACWCGFLLPQNNTKAIWRDIMSAISTGLKVSSPYLMPDIELWGGAIHDKARNETAFPYRSATYNVGVLLTIPDDAHDAAMLFDHHSRLVNAWWPKVAKYLTGSYVNYPMTSLHNYPHEYWGDNLERLVEIKNKHDPDNVFNFPMSVPTSISY